MDWRAVRKCELITETLNAKPQALHDSYVWDSPIAPHSDDDSSMQEAEPWELLECRRKQTVFSRLVCEATQGSGCYARLLWKP